MTMLDRMRRHKNWLKWSLAIVVVAFILLYIPNFLRNGIGGAAATGTRDVIASVEGQTITVGQFRRIYQQQMQAYRRAYGGNIDDRLLKQMGIDRRILQQLIDEEAGLAEAHRLGISTSDEEVRARILALPAFQENGQFIGDARYRQLLQMSDPPRRPSEFEEEVRRSSSNSTRTTTAFPRSARCGTRCSICRRFATEPSYRRRTSSGTTRTTSSSTRRPNRSRRVTSSSRPKAKTTRR